MILFCCASELGLPEDLSFKRYRSYIILLLLLLLLLLLYIKALLNDGMGGCYAEVYGRRP